MQAPARTQWVGRRAPVSLVQRPQAPGDIEAAAADGLPTAAMIVNGERCCVKLDSGARYSVAGTKWMMRGERLQKTAPVDFVEGIGGFLLDVLGVWSFKMHNAYGQVVLVEACIVEGCVDEFLVGVDFMKQHQALMDFSRNEVRYDDKGEHVVIPFRTDGDDGDAKVAAVRLAASARLEKDAVVPIRVCVAAPDGEEGLFIPTYHTGPVMLAATVTKATGGTALVPAINLRGDSIKLPGRKELGVWVPVDGELEVLSLNGALETDKISEWLASLGDTETPLNDENEVNIGVEDCTARELVIRMLRVYRELLMHQGDCPPATALPVQHHIDTGDTRPIMLKRRRHAQTEDAVIEENVEKMLAAGVIEESNGAWGFPVVLVRKKDGEIRFCIDYRALNSVTKRDVYPLPRIDETLETLGGATLFTTLDLKAGYWQIEVAPDDRDKTAFTTKQGLYRFVRMPFGLTNAPSTFQRVMNGVLRGLTWQTCLVYLDDIVIFTRGGIERHIAQVAAVLERLAVAGLTLKLRKCVFAAKSMEYLGHLLSGEGVRPVERLIHAVREFPRPRDPVEIKRFVHLAGYYRKFVDSFGSIVAPLTRLLKKDARWEWTEDQEFAFERVKAALTAEPLLIYPNFALPFRLVTDASMVGLGACLMQDQGRGWQPISYASKVNSDAEAKYSITELECLAVVWAVKLYRPYLYGRQFEILTDHSALRWLMTRPNPAGRLHRWSLTLQEYEFTITYRPGTTNVVADALSRAPVAVLAATSKKRRRRRERTMTSVATEEKTEGDEPLTSAEDGIHAENGASRPASDVAAAPPAVKPLRAEATTSPAVSSAAATNEMMTTNNTMAAGRTTRTNDMIPSADGPDGGRRPEASPETSTVAATASGGDSVAGQQSTKPRGETATKMRTNEVGQKGERTNGTRAMASGSEPSTTRLRARPTAAAETNKTAVAGDKSAHGTMAENSRAAAPGPQTETRRPWTRAAQRREEVAAAAATAAGTTTAAPTVSAPTMNEASKQDKRLRCSATAPETTRTTTAARGSSDVDDDARVVMANATNNLDVNGVRRPTATQARPESPRKHGERQRVDHSGETEKTSVPDARPAARRTKQIDATSKRRVSWAKPSEDDDEADTPMPTTTATGDAINQPGQRTRRVISEDGTWRTVVLRNPAPPPAETKSRGTKTSTSTRPSTTQSSATRSGSCQVMNDQRSDNAEAIVSRQATATHDVALDENDEPLPVGTLQLTDDEIIDAQKASNLVKKLLEAGTYSGMKIEKVYGLVVINTQRGRRVVLPPALWAATFKELHGSVWAGHLRGPHTYGRVAQLYWWPNLRREVNAWVRGCPECGSRKAKPREVVPPLRSIRGGDVGDRWALDVAGPFPIADGGERYVIAAVEYVTRYAVARCVKQHTAENVATFLMEDVVLKFGVFRELLTDGAPELTGYAIDLLVNMMQARQVNPVPYRPQMIGLVERYHRTWKDVVATFMTADTQDDWNLWVKFAVYAYNSAQHSTVALTPNELMMGRRLRTPNELLKRTQVTEAGELAAYQDKLLLMMKASHENAERARVKEQTRQAKYYNRNAKTTKTWKTGDRVWLYNPPRGLRATKFVHKWMGPLRVVEPAGYENFLLEREDETGEPKTLIAHSSFLISYHYPRSLLKRAAEDLDVQLENENPGETTRDESSNRAPVRTATSANNHTPTGAGTKRDRAAMATSSGTRSARNKLVELRRRRRRNKAGQYVLEYQLRPIGTQQWTLCDVRWRTRDGQWQDRWVSVGEYDELFNDGRLVEEPQVGEVV